MTPQEIKQRLGELQWTQDELAEKIGRNRVTVSRWLNGRAPIDKATMLLLQQLLQQHALAPLEEASGVVRIPIYDLTASAGGGAFNMDECEVVEQMPFPSSWIQHKLRVSPRQLSGLRIEGDSMEPVARSGDLIILDRSKQHPGDGYYVLNIEGTVVFKKTQWQADRRTLRVLSENPVYQEMVFDEHNAAQISVIGRAVYCIRAL